MGLLHVQSFGQTEIQCGCTIWRDCIINLTYKMKQILVNHWAIICECVLSFITTSNICREFAGQIELIIRHGLGSTHAKILSYFTLCIVGGRALFWLLKFVSFQFYTNGGTTRWPSNPWPAVPTVPRSASHGKRFNRTLVTKIQMYKAILTYANRYYGSPLNEKTEKKIDE
jgi:hypothetical protein